MELETRRLLLRPLSPDDAPALVRALNNFEVSRWLARVPFPYTADMAHEFIARQAGFDDRSCVAAIAFKCAPEELVGVISYEARSDGSTAFGYFLNESCWGLRLMSEAASAMVHHAFAQGGITELQAGYRNPVSGKLLARLGFEETHREATFCMAENRTVSTMKVRVLRSQWLAQQKSRAA